MVISVPEFGADPAELRQIAPPTHPAGQVAPQVKAHDLLYTAGTDRAKKAFRIACDKTC